MGDYVARLAETLAQQGQDVLVFVAERNEERSAKTKWATLKRAATGTECAEGAMREGGASFAAGERRQAAALHNGNMRVVELKLDGWGNVARAVETIRSAHPERVQIEYSSYGWSRWGFAFWFNAFVSRLRRAGLRVTLALHEIPIEFEAHPWRAAVAAMQRLHFAGLVRAADEIVTNTPGRVRLMRGWFSARGKPIVFRPNSATIPVSPMGGARRAELRATHGADGGTLVVATFGFFHAAKRYEEVIEAVAQMPPRPAMTLWLLGDTRATQPAYLEKLRAHVGKKGLEGKVWWSGHLEAADISAALQTTDIFVLPQGDGHLTRSSAFMAAAAHGLAVIAVRNEENQQAFTHGADVWLVERASAESFAEAIRRLAGDAALRERLGRNLRVLYEQEFSWAAVVGRGWRSARKAVASG